MYLNAKLTAVSVGLTCLLVLGGAVGPAQCRSGGRSERADRPMRLNVPDLPNAIRLHPKVISGGCPDGADGFRQLARLGVKTVISVDGLKPDAGAAKNFGVRYVHLPHGYDGIQPKRVRELAKAIHELPGPVYIHCHHGKHRSPAAAVSACITLGYLPRDLGEPTLKLAGTGQSYAGLYKSVRDAKRLPISIIEAVCVEFSETVDQPSIVEVMTKLETITERLERYRGRDWKSADTNPDQTALYDALLLQEQFTELMRDPVMGKKDGKFRATLRESELAAKQLQKSLAAATYDTKRAALWLTRVRENCVRCHQSFRN